MTRYIPASAASALSAALWALARPDNSGESTQFLFATASATDGSDWLVALDDYDIPIHSQADLGGIAAILQPFIDAKQLPADTNTQLAALVESKRGQRLVVYDAFPQIFKDMSKTREEMIAAGLLPEHQMP